MSRNVSILKSDFKQQPLAKASANKIISYSLYFHNDCHAYGHVKLKKNFNEWIQKQLRATKIDIKERPNKKTKR